MGVRQQQLKDMIALGVFPPKPTPYRVAGISSKPPKFVVQFGPAGNRIYGPLREHGWDRSTAEHVCDLLNEAYQMGAAGKTPVVQALPPLKVRETPHELVRQQEQEREKREAQYRATRAKGRSGRPA